jgi:hypothetical protein
MDNIRVPQVTSQVSGAVTHTVTPDVLNESNKVITVFTLFVPQVGNKHF